MRVCVRANEMEILLLTHVYKLWRCCQRAYKMACRLRKFLVFLDSVRMRYWKKTVCRRKRILLASLESSVWMSCLRMAYKRVCRLKMILLAIRESSVRMSCWKMVGRLKKTPLESLESSGSYQRMACKKVYRPRNLLVILENNEMTNCWRKACKMACSLMMSRVSNERTSYWRLACKMGCKKMSLLTRVSID